MFNKCFWLGHAYKPVVSTSLTTAEGLHMTYVGHMCTRCSRTETERLTGAHITLEQLQQEYK